MQPPNFFSGTLHSKICSVSGKECVKKCSLSHASSCKFSRLSLFCTSSNDKNWSWTWSGIWKNARNRIEPTAFLSLGNFGYHYRTIKPISWLFPNINQFFDTEEVPIEFFLKGSIPETWMAPIRFFWNEFLAWKVDSWRFSRRPIQVWDLNSSKLCVIDV